MMKTVVNYLGKTCEQGFKVGKKLTKLAGLNVALKMAQGRQKEHYREIGEHIHNQEAGATSSQITKIREQIVTEERRVRKLVEEINRVKRLESCANCGHVSKMDGKYCPKCSKVRK